MKLIEVNNVSREFVATEGIIQKKKKIIEAVKEVSFAVNKGEVFGLLGPNGAGKTTMIKMMTTLLIPSSGTLKVLGNNVDGDEKKVRSKINFVFGGERNLYWRLSAYDNLSFMADIYLIPKKRQKKLIEDLLIKVGLDKVCHRKVETYSKGMKQRLQIAKALLNEPKILFLDEPTIGLDPVGAMDLRKIIKDVQREGTTIILTTHYMAEAEELCDRIAIMKEGEILVLDETAVLKKQILDESSSLEEVYIRLMKGVERVAG